MTTLEHPFLYEGHERKEREKISEREVDSFLELQTIVTNRSLEKKYSTGLQKEIFKSLAEDLTELLNSTRDYIRSADFQNHYKKNKKEVTIENRDMQYAFDSDRKATHNLLIADMNIISRKLKLLGIDNKFIYAINNKETDLDPENEDDRRAVERWARRVGEYLFRIGLSENT